MHAPTHERTPTERTEIRLAYDDEYLYAAASCYDSEPERIHANSLTRDGLNPSDDSFGLVLDSFNDNENALVFITTPAGLREDWAVANDAVPQLNPFPFNSSWSTFWDVAVSRSDSGWFVELRIPFSSLRFQDRDGYVTMGLIVWRYIARKNEVHCFPNIPPKWDWAIIKPSVAQKVSLEGLYSKNPVYVTPYVLGGTGYSYDLNDVETKYLRTESRRREVGLDLKIGLTSNITLDLTLNTDFAQVEADDQQVNLTRFSLFFPEKRLFFQERSSIFDVGMGGPNRLFYSRQIGISEEGPVRLYGGARLVGRIGEWDLGVLNIQSAPSVELPSENFGVLRLRRQILNDHSTVGFLTTSRVGNDGSYNYTYGLDGIVRLGKDDYLLLNWAQTFDDEIGQTKVSSFMQKARSRVQWERRSTVGFGYEISLSHAGEHFDPAMGFAPRVDYTRIGDRIFFGWLPGEDSPLFHHTLSLVANAFYRNSDGSLESSELGPQWNFNFKSGAFGFLYAKAFSERLEEEFKLSDEVMVPVGRYSFWNAGAMYQTPWGSLLRSGFTVDGGSFYDGSRLSFGLSPVWSISKHIEVGADYQYNQIRFRGRGQSLHAHLMRMRMKATANTELSATMFVQVNTASDQLILNVRFRYNPREGNDLYFVYNEGINIDRYARTPPPPHTETRAMILKYSHTLQF
jgi:hypothetical protein